MTNQPKSGDLQVWWVPQVPMTPFTVKVETPQEAKKILSVLAAYDLFQLDQNIKPDFCNAGGLNVFENGEWEDWYDPQTGEDIDVWEEWYEIGEDIDEWERHND